MGDLSNKKKLVYLLLDENVKYMLFDYQMSKLEKKANIKYEVKWTLI